MKLVNSQCFIYDWFLGKKPEDSGVLNQHTKHCYERKGHCTRRRDARGDFDNGSRFMHIMALGFKSED